MFDLSIKRKTILVASSVHSPLRGFKSNKPQRNAFGLCDFKLLGITRNLK